MLSLLADKMIDYLYKNCQTTVPFPSNMIKQYLLIDSNQNAQIVYDKLVTMAGEGSPNEQRLAASLAVVRYELNRLLKTTLKKKGSSEYILSRKNKKLLYTIPCLANNTPLEGSQFVHYIETTNKTFQYYSHGWTEKHVTKAFLLWLQEKEDKYEEMNAEKELLELRKNVKKRTGITLTHFVKDDESQVKQAHKKLQQIFRRDEADPWLIQNVIEFVSWKVLFNQVDIFQKQYSINSQDLAYLFNASQSYSGTMGSLFSFPEKMTPVETIETDYFVTKALLANQLPLKTVSAHNAQELLVQLLTKSGKDLKARAIIDTAAFFHGVKNLEVAKNILYYYGKNSVAVRAMVFWDDEINTPTLLAWKNGKCIKLAIHSTERTEYFRVLNYLGIHADQVFTYYDQRHTIGANIPQSKGITALVTFGTKEGKDKDLQGVMRMRGLLLGGQKIQFFLDEKSIKIVAKTVGKRVGDLDVKDLLKYGTKIQAIHELELNTEAIKQKITAHFRNFFRNKLLYDKENFLLWHFYSKDLFSQNVTGANSSPISLVKELGSLLKDDSAENVLKEFLDSIMMRIPPLFALRSPKVAKMLQEEAETIIDRAIKAKGLPRVLTVPAGGEVDLPQEEGVAHALQNQTREAECRQKQERELETVNFSCKTKMCTQFEKHWKITFFPKQITLDKIGVEDKKFKVVSLREAMEATPKLKAFTPLFDERLMVSENFLRTFKEENFTLLTGGGKPALDVLLSQHDGQWKFTLISTKEAGRLAKQLFEMKKKGEELPSVWLADAQGDVYLTGQKPFSELSTQTKNVWRKVSLQTCLLTGNMIRFQQRQEEFDKWAKELEPKELEQRVHSKKQLASLLWTLMEFRPDDKRRWIASPSCQKTLPLPIST